MGASNPRKIEIMDTTLGMVKPLGFSFSGFEKLTLIAAIEELEVDRIEVASARVSEGEFDAVRRITDWAAENGHLSEVGKS